MIDNLSPELLRYHAWTLLHYAYDLIIKIEEDTYRVKAGVSYQQFLILMAVATSENPVTVVELARILQRQPNSISTIVDRMVKQALVKREPCKTDRRLVYVKLSPAGKNIVTRAAIEGNELIKRVMSEFSEKEARMMVKLFEKLTVLAAREAGIEHNPAEQAMAIVQKASGVFSDIVAAP